MKLISIAILSLAATVLGLDPIADQAKQRAFLAQQLSHGKSRRGACAAAAAHFKLRCVVLGDDFVLSRGAGTKITYLATIHLPSRESHVPDR